MLILEITILCCLFQAICANEWTYFGKLGASDWKTYFPSCGKDEQSPINIYEGDSSGDATLISQPFQFHNYDKVDGVKMTMENNGHTAVVKIEGTTQVTLTGGGLPKGVFRAIQLHFHWGSNNKRGSEHFISTRVFPMEVHIVHYNAEKYRDLEHAIQFKDGLAVLAFMFEIESENPNYSTIVSNLPRIKTKGSTVVIPTVSLTSLLPPIFHHFYRYQGSLTTPACHEVVTWSVYKEVIKISEAQLESFRTLQDHLGRSMVDNFRPVQPLNSRAVTANFDSPFEWDHGYRTSAASWGNFFSKCNGENQSPVNLVEKDTYYQKELDVFDHKNVDETYNIQTVIKNNGHTAQIDIIAGELTIARSALPDVYKAARLDFHWGSDNRRGSEHTLDGHAYPMEMQVVFFRESLGRLEDAMTVPDGLAILVWFFEISDTDNPALKPIIDELPKIIKPGNGTVVRHFSPKSILPSYTYKFFRYRGSLTTPDCDETVIWTIFHDTINISESQLNAFRRLQTNIRTMTENNLPIKENFRPVQSLNNRVVRRNYRDPNEIIRWSYRSDLGPRTWNQKFPYCDNARDSLQSPINIKSSHVQYQRLDSFNFLSYNNSVFSNMDLINTGRIAQLDIYAGGFSLTGGGLDHEYRACHLQFHWGSDNQRGSEHLINDRAYPMELHIVHHDIRYVHVAAAANNLKGLAILAFMYEVTEEPNPAYDVVVEKLSKIRYPNTRTSVEGVSLESLLPLDMEVYYRYSGSQTAPNCKEVVVWSVFKNTIKISQAQLNAFRTLLSLDFDPVKNTYLPMVDNFRPVMNLNNREIFSNFGGKLRRAYSTNISTRLSSCNIAGVSLFALFVFFVEKTPA